MTWDEAFKLISSAIIAVGGGGAMVLALSSWLGKVWAERILIADRDKYQRQLEKLKSELTLDVERLKADLALKLEIAKRLSENQFHLYNDLWSSLCDLKISADGLWERVDRTSLKKFADQLKKTKAQILRSSLLVEHGHYESLKDLMDQFSNFEFNKTRILEIRSSSDIGLHNIENTIRSNRHVKERYSALISEIEVFFRSRIRGVE